MVYQVFYIYLLKIEQAEPNERFVDDNINSDST